MANIIPLKDNTGAQFYPQTHEKAVVDSNGVNLQTKLASITTPTYVTAWDGDSTPVVANIPSGVTVTYDGTSYTGTLAASASTANKTYLVGTGTTDNYNRYVTQLNGSTYSWQNLGSTEIDLSDYATKEELNQLEAEVGDKLENGIQKQTYSHSSFTSQTPNITLPENMKFYVPGDYIEVKVNSNGATGQIVRRNVASNVPGIKYTAENTLVIRVLPGSSNFAYQNAAVDATAIQTIRTQIVSVSADFKSWGIEFYLDGTKIGDQVVTTTGSTQYLTFIDQIGYQSVADLYYMKVKSNGTETTYTKFSEMTGAVGVTDVYTGDNYDGLIPLNERLASAEASIGALQAAVIGEDMYYQYITASSTYNALHEFRIYQRIAGQYYIATRLIYYKFSTTYPDGYWRIERIDLVTIVDGTVTSLQSQIITAGENEFVLQWLAGSGYNFSGGFAGGYHGGETVEATGAFVEFIVDGNRVTPTADIPLTPCKTFAYHEFTPIYQHNDDSIAAWHLKETAFKDGGYETMSDVRFIQALDYFAYNGIVCVSRWLSEKAMPEGVATITDMGTGTPVISEQFKSNGHRIHYEGNGYMCDVFSEVLIGADDSQCQRVVYNSTAYNKYYRRNPDTAGSTANRLKGRTKVKISAM